MLARCFTVINNSNNKDRTVAAINIYWTFFMFQVQHRTFACCIPFIPYNYPEIGAIVIPTLQSRNLKRREVKSFARVKTR